MGETKDKYLIVHTKNNLTKKEKKEIFHHNKNKERKPKKSKGDTSNV